MYGLPLKEHLLNALHKIKLEGVVFFVEVFGRVFDDTRFDKQTLVSSLFLSGFVCWVSFRWVVHGEGEQNGNNM